MDMSVIAAKFGPAIIGVGIAVIMFYVLYSFKPIVAILLYGLIGFTIGRHYLELVLGETLGQWLIIGVAVIAIVLFFRRLTRQNREAMETLAETTGRDINFKPRFRYLREDELFSGAENRAFFPNVMEQIRNEPFHVSYNNLTYKGYKDPQDRDEEIYNEMSKNWAMSDRFRGAVGARRDSVLWRLEEFCSVQYPDFPVCKPYLKSFASFSDGEKGGSFTLDEALTDRWFRKRMGSIISQLEKGGMSLRSLELGMKDFQTYHKCICVVYSKYDNKEIQLPDAFRIEGALRSCYWNSGDDVKDYLENNVVEL